MVRGPTVGRSNRKSCCGFDRLTTTAPFLGQIAAALDIPCLVLSNASTATHHADFDHNAPPNIETPDFMHHFPPVADVLPLFLRWGPSGQRPFFHENPLKPEGCITDHNAFPLNLRGNFTQNVIISPQSHPSEEGQSPEVRADSREDMSSDAAKHDGPFNAICFPGSKLTGLVELTNLDPVDTVDMLFEFRLCFADMRPAHVRRTPAFWHCPQR